MPQQSMMPGANVYEEGWLNRLVIIGFAITEDAGSSYSASPTCMQFANELHGEYVMAYRHAIETLATLNYDSIIEQILESR